MNPLFPSLYSLPPNVETRWASPENPAGTRGAGARENDGRKGRPCLPLKAGGEVVLASASGTSGVVRRIWLTIEDRSPAALRGLRIDMYWDDAPTPAVSAPLGDFFGQGVGRCQIFESIFFSNPEGRSFNCCLPMPFLTGFRIVLTNESQVNIRMVFYDVNYTLGDVLDGPSYLHAHWRRESPTELLRDYEVLPKVVGRGRYLGANFGVIVDTASYFDSWWGEGECKLFLDGDTTHPTLAGTGTEDYIGTAWGQGQYARLYQGCHLADTTHWQFAFYRYHVPDPVYFSQEVRVTFQQIGGGPTRTLHQMRDVGVQLTGIWPVGKPVDMNLTEDKFTLFERQDDWSSCCYFYLDRPENGLPPLAPVQHRTHGLLEAGVEVFAGAM